ncbi:MAG: polysaccharide deacetylase family protein, partial [Clostridia bacterium]|nr:polysaccharide deacetylase family protein [Clostridia bacterium]
MKIKNKIDSLSIKIVSNLVMSVLMLSVGVLCLAPTQKDIATEGKESNVYRSATQNARGVSLMFNVYWGTDEVYQILDILTEHEAKATFFIGGCWADDNVECLKAIYAQGHEIGNHGYFHKEHSKMSLAANQKEISDCNRFIKLALGIDCELFAPPSGAYGVDTITACKSLQ